MRILLSDLRKVAMERPGLWDDFTRAGRIEGDCLNIQRDEFDCLNRHWFQGPKLGTLLHAVLAPAAAVMDKTLGTDFAGCGARGGREIKMNAGHWW